MGGVGKKEHSAIPRRSVTREKWSALADFGLTCGHRRFELSDVHARLFELSRVSPH